MSEAVHSGVLHRPDSAGGVDGGNITESIAHLPDNVRSIVVVDDTKIRLVSLIDRFEIHIS